MIRWSFFDGHRLPTLQACNVPGSMPSRLAIAFWLSPSVLRAAISDISTINVSVILTSDKIATALLYCVTLHPTVL